MKKIVLSLMFASAGYVAMAQDYSKVTTMYTLKKYEDAKNELDKIATSDKGKDKPETYLWTAAINSELFKDSSLSSKYPDAADKAYTAFETYEKADPELKALKASATIGSIGNLYNTIREKGFNAYNEKNYQQSFADLAKAVKLSEFIIGNGFSGTNKAALDTATVLYTAYAAQNMGNVDSAVRYYEKLATAKVAGKGYDEMYRLLLLDLTKLQQPDKFKQYDAQAKELYPDQASLWSQLEMDNMTGSATVAQIIDKYKAEANGQLTEDQLIAYAEALNDPEKTKALDSAQQVDIRMQSADIYKKLFALNPKGIYAFNAGVLNYNMFSVLDDRSYALRGESASLKTQRANIQKQQVVFADTAIAWLEKGYDILKAKTDREKRETNSLNRSVDYLANLYMWKRERAKGIAPKDYDKYDAKYNTYSNEHDKYKDS